MADHASRMDIVRLHQRAEDAENEMRQAQLVASMEAQAQERVQNELMKALAEIDRLTKDRDDFFLKMKQTEGERADAVKELKDVTLIMQELHLEVSTGKQQIAALIQENRDNNEKARSIFHEREQMENTIAQLEAEMGNHKARAKADNDRLTKLGIDSQKAHEAEVLQMKRDFAETESKLQYELTEKTKKMVSLEQALADRTTAYENEITDLKQALLVANRAKKDEEDKAKALQDQIDETQRTIWLRRYDPSSPRSPRPGYIHERESDPNALVGAGLYAGQVGYSKF
jgi:hypothetical protein